MPQNATRVTVAVSGFAGDGTHAPSTLDVVRNYWKSKHADISIV